MIEEACRRVRHRGGDDTLGRGVGRVVADPEKELVEYDLVFATARSAIEAIVAGAATVVVDGRGLAGTATRANIEWLRQHNFGLRSLVHDVTVESIRAEIDRYDADEAAALSAKLRPLVDVEPHLDAFEQIYAEAIEEFSSLRMTDAHLLADLVPILPSMAAAISGNRLALAARAGGTTRAYRTTRCLARTRARLRCPS